jgi:aminoglycoside/choline kinase family phosphotransferase
MGWDPARTVALPLAARGSGRTFARLQCGRSRACLVRYTLERRENALYAPHARFLRGLGLRVPAVLHDDPGRQYTIYEDLGDVLLRDRVGAVRNAAALRAMYVEVLDGVIRLHRRGRAQASRRRLVLMPPFTRGVFRWEHDLFVDCFLKPRGAPPAATVRAIRADLDRLGRRLARATRVLVHRDLQSTNILLTSTGPAFIDFQGMRAGPPAYDLASLLCDPYVMLPEPLQTDLLAYYAAGLGAGDVEAVRLFWPAAVQRLVQALGAYGRLGGLEGCRRFLEHIGPATRMLQRAVRHVPGMNGLRQWLEG